MKSCYEEGSRIEFVLIKGTWKQVLHLPTTFSSYLLCPYYVQSFGNIAMNKTKPLSHEAYIPAGSF